MVAELAVDEEERKLFQRSLSSCISNRRNEGWCIPSMVERSKEFWKAVTDSVDFQRVEVEVGSSMCQRGETFESQID